MQTRVALSALFAWNVFVWTVMTILAELREKANHLPLSPGVYLMKDSNGKIIYIGKSKALKNRVSQYFQEGAAHNRKTAAMVMQVRSFETMYTDTEMEALSLENRLIKLHTPKYNIRLKDAKSYPYIKVTTNELYPRITVVRKRLADRASYFGPYSGVSVAYDIVNTARKCFGIPSCKRKFPADIGKGRPCLNFQMGLCPGICTGQVDQTSYQDTVNQLLLFLRGDVLAVEQKLQEKMLFASENLQFETAASCRDRIASLAKLRQKQKIVASPDVESDVFALYSDDVCSILTVFYIRNGYVSDSESFHFAAEQIIDSETVTAFLSDLYEKREFIPKQILFGFDLDPDTEDMLGDWLKKKAGYKVQLLHPSRGEKKQLCDMVAENAHQQAVQYRFEKEKDDQVLVKLASMLSLEVVPERIESYDISNYGAEHTTAGKVVLSGTKFCKNAYRVYRIHSITTPNDYAAMKEAVSRRLDHPEDPYPDLILLDGGKGHVSTIRNLLRERKIDIPVFGMVKDDYHKTRMLVGEQEEISIASEQSVFLLIYRLQEEVHRFTIRRMTEAKRKTLKTSSLEVIPGIGPSKARILLMHFPSPDDIAKADVDALSAVKGISRTNAQKIWEHFHENT